MSQEEQWRIITIISTAREFESEVRELIFSLEDEVKITSMECSHPHRNTSIFMQLVLEATAQDVREAERFGLTVKMRVSRLAEATSVITRM